MGAQRAVAPVLTGSVPPLAAFYHARQETGFGLAAGLRPGETILLVPALLGTGGTGKTQLAVGFAHTVWAARAVDLVAWVPAGNRSAVIAGYAQAAADLEALTGDEAAGTADSGAQRFLGWLRRTERPWVVVLDGVASPAVVTVTETTCRDYRAEYAQRLRATTDTIVDGCPPSLLATWSLAVERAHELPPAGLSWPALVFASVLDTSGIPAAVLTSPAACAYITGQPSTGQAGAAGGERNLVRSAYANLERLGLLSVDNTNAVRTVWLHSAVRAAVRAYLAPGNVEQAVAAAAAALLEAWPERGYGHAQSLFARDRLANAYATAGRYPGPEDR